MRIMFQGRQWPRSAGLIMAAVLIAASCGSDTVAVPADTDAALPTSEVTVRASTVTVPAETISPTDPAEPVAPDEPAVAAEHPDGWVWQNGFDGAPEAVVEARIDVDGNALARRGETLDDVTPALVVGSRGRLADECCEFQEYDAVIAAEADWDDTTGGALLPTPMSIDAAPSFTVELVSLMTPDIVDVGSGANAIARIGDTIVVGGWIESTGDEREGDAAVWTSLDRGQSFTFVESGALGGELGQYINKIVTTADGFVAFGREGGQVHIGSAVIWRSPDGIGWDRVELGEDSQAAEISDVLVTADGALLALPHWAFGAVVLRSTDGGSSWSEHPVAERLRRLLVLDERVIEVRSRLAFADGLGDTELRSSLDGITWSERVPLPGDDQIGTLLVADGQLHIIDYDGYWHAPCPDQVCA